MVKMLEKKRVAFKTLGCRLNQYETDALVTQFHNAGYDIVDFGSKSDVTVINTCTVTNQSDQKSRNYISQASSINPNGVLVVAGCMVNNRKDQLEKQENITYVIENEKKNSIFSLVDAHFKGEILHPENLSADVFGFETVEKSLHTRTSIKIQDGCDNFCTFCIIPKVRGRAVSRPLNDILDNVKRVVDNGFKELVITGVNIGRYQHDNYRIEQALEKILEVPGDFRVRISSIEPDGFGKDFPSLFHHPKLAPHLHLCLQSGSDKVLMQMRRMYNRRSFMTIVEEFRKMHPDFNFTTDIIVGFPGETEENFLETLSAAKEAKFSHIHTFRYSVRKGTRAERMENQISEKLKSERSAVIRGISDENKKEYYAKMKGSNQKILIESIDSKGFARGFGQHYIPVKWRNPEAIKNSFEELILSDLNINFKDF
jgi:threonylcarbamoyladenosine tRNA methylthiotransferase MtaB